jgi:hypothetical protein
MKKLYKVSAPSDCEGRSPYRIMARFRSKTEADVFRSDRGTTKRYQAMSDPTPLDVEEEALRIFDTAQEAFEFYGITPEGEPKADLISQAVSKLSPEELEALRHKFAK